MKTNLYIILSIIFLLAAQNNVGAQSVNLIIPAENIINRTEFVRVQNVLYTNESGWKGFWFWIEDPMFNTTSSAIFRHTSTNNTLPTEILQYRLADIGGREPLFSGGDGWPGFKNFSSSPQSWYNPSFFSSHPKGNINFTFKIPATKFISEAFQAGEYSMDITHNYAGIFTPNSFRLALKIPALLSWISTNNIIYNNINSLEQFRSVPAQLETNLGFFELANTVDFNLFANTTSTNIQFTSSTGVNGTRPVSILSLGGDRANINILPLSRSRKQYTANPLVVGNGNRNNFHLKLLISENDFKNNFFEAGTYKFQINLDAKSADNLIAAPQNIDFTLKVESLSEIVLPTGGNQVNFEFNTISHYQNGQSKSVPNQLRISNNETYELYVKADVPFFKRNGIQSAIPSNILQIGVVGGSQQVGLTTSAKKIISNGTPTLDKNLNIKYTIAPNAAQSLVNKEKSTYSINVVYSFTAI